jgi:imidazole glycerol phosphate synthase subunit HisF
MHAILCPFSPYQLFRLTDSQAALAAIFFHKSTIDKNKLKRPPNGRCSQKAIKQVFIAFPL